jgi:hypothetical protein
MWLELIQAPNRFLKNQTEQMRKPGVTAELEKVGHQCLARGLREGCRGRRAWKTANNFMWCVRGRHGYEAR